MLGNYNNHAWPWRRNEKMHFSTFFEEVWNARCGTANVRSDSFDVWLNFFLNSFFFMFYSLVQGIVCWLGERRDAYSEMKVM